MSINQSWRADWRDLKWSCVDITVNEHKIAHAYSHIQIDSLPHWHLIHNHINYENHEKPTESGCSIKALVWQSQRNNQRRNQRSYQRNYQRRKDSTEITGVMINQIIYAVIKRFMIRCYQYHHIKAR